MSEYIVEVTGQMPDAIYERELEEIVRCRDCKFALINTLGDCKYCEKFWDSDGDAQLNLPGDFFCAWGERRGDVE